MKNALLSLIQENAGKLSSHRLLNLLYGVVFCFVLVYTTLTGKTVQPEIIWMIAGIVGVGGAVTAFSKRCESNSNGNGNGGA